MKDNKTRFLNKICELKTKLLLLQICDDIVNSEYLPERCAGKIIITREDVQEKDRFKKSRVVGLLLLRIRRGPRWRRFLVLRFCILLEILIQVDAGTRKVLVGAKGEGASNSAKASCYEFPTEKKTYWNRLRCSS